MEPQNEALSGAINDAVSLLTTDGTAAIVAVGAAMIGVTVMLLIFRVVRRAF